MKLDSWFHITAEADTDHAEIMIYSPIGQSFWEDRIDAKTFVAQLDALDVSSITLRVNSPGGHVFDGVAIHNALRRHRAEVTCVVEGLCASIATVIALGADRIEMCPTSWFMIHNSSILAAGNADELRKSAELLESLDRGVVAAYAAKTGADTEWIKAEMAREAWYTADEALEHGFIDAILDEDADQAELAAAAKFDASALVNFRHPPEQLAETLRPAAGPLAPRAPQASRMTPAAVTLDGVKPAPAASSADGTWEVDVARARREREAASR